MKHALRIPLVLICSLLPVGPALAGLESDIHAILQDKLLDKAAVGVMVVQLSPTGAQDRLLFQTRPELPLAPASNMKVITSSAILDALGPEFRFRTLLVKHGDDLVLVGDGDPTFGDAELLKKSNWTTTTVFQNWAEQLKKAGLSSFNRLLVDDSVFDAVLFHPRWDPNQGHSRFSAEVAGMTLNAGGVDLAVHASAAGRLASYTMNPPTRYLPVQNTCVGGTASNVILDRLKGTNSLILKGSCPAGREVSVSITVHDPALYAGTVLAETLASHGITIGAVARDRTVREKVMQHRSDEGFVVLAVHETPLLAAMTHANKESINPYAEAMCKRLGAAVSGASGSWENGPAAAGVFLKKTGASEADFHLDDGSGLSHENRISARTMMGVLRYDFHGPNREAFIATLAVGGKDGTLDERFKNDLRGRVMAKTGYIVGVSALSGYLKGKDEQWYAFCILMNGIPKGANSRAKQLQEAIVKVVDANTKGSH